MKNTLEILTVLIIIPLITSCGQIESLVQDSGKIAESFGQMPRSIINDALGTNAKTDQDLYDLQDEVSELRREILLMFAKVGNNIDEVVMNLRDSINISEVNKKDLEDAIQDLHTELADKINNDIVSYADLLADINNVENDVQLVNDLINGLSVNCDDIKTKGSTKLQVTCEILGR